MNINKLQAQLQRVPDDALIGYVQNPDGQVPSYLALAELSRRKEIRKSATPQQAMPTQTVAAQELAQAQPGIAQLPVREDMFNEESYASGGIVAFADGGSTGFRLAGAENPLSMMGVSGDLLARINELKKNNPWMTEEALKAKIASEAAAPQMSAAEKKMYEGRPAPTPLNYDRPTVKQISEAAVPPLASTTVARPQTGIATPAVAPMDRVSYVAPADLSAGYDENLRPEVSAQEAMAKYQGLMGTDVGREKVKERLAGMESKAAKEEERAPWMALAEAGLGIAGGKSQFALQNIAEGGTKGLKSYAEAKDRLNKAEERRFEMESKIAQAERAEQAAAATYGLQSEEAARAGREANRLAKLGYKASLESDKAKGEFDAKKTNLSADIEVAKLGEEKRYHNLWYDATMEKAKKDASTLEKSIRSNETAQLKALLSESGDRLDKLMAAGVEKTDPLYVKSLEIYNGAANALGLKAGVSTTPAQTGPRKKPLSAF